MKTPITLEWVQSLEGFEQNLDFFVKSISDGPGDSRVSITIGGTPWNHHGVMVYVGNYGVLTNADCQEDVLELIRLLEGGRIEHPYEEDFGDLFDEDEPEHAS